MELWKFPPPTKNQNKQAPLVCRGRHRFSRDFLLFAKLLSLARFSFAVLSSFHFPQVQFEQKNSFVRKRETLSKTEIWSRSGPQLWGLGFGREPKDGTSTFPAHNICPPLPSLRLSIPSSEMITAGIKEPEFLLVYTTAVTETFEWPVTTHNRGSLLVSTGQMAATEPPVPKWNLMNLEWFAL